MDWSGIEYVGVDVVPAVIEGNVRRYGAGNIRFVSLDALCDPLPTGELLIVKDVFQHWPNDLITGFAARMEQYRHVLITNTIEESTLGGGPNGHGRLNDDISLGELRPVDSEQRRSSGRWLRCSDTRRFGGASEWSRRNRP